MEQNCQYFRSRKKLTSPTTREITTPLIMLRGLSLGLTFYDMCELEVGEIIDMLIEQANDSYDYPKKGTQEDFAKLFGG